MRSTALAFFLLLTIAACGGPRSYDQCILENVRSGMSDDAVRAIQEACRGEFPPEEAPASDLDDLEDVIGDGEIIDEPVADSVEAVTEEGY